MNVSSVKNLNGETFSAVQDADLTTVVQTNSGNWQDITAYQNASANYLTAVNIPESADWNDTTTAYQTNSATYLTAHQAISANEWNSNYETVTTNSGIWNDVSVYQTNSATYMTEPNLEYNAVNEISGYNGSAIAQYGAEKQWLVHDDTLCHLSNSSQYALGVNVSALQRLLGIDETVLYSGNSTAGVELSEDPTNFNYLRIDYGATNSGNNANVLSINVPAGITNYGFSHLFKSQPNSTATGDVYKSYSYYSGCNTTTWVKVYGTISQTPFTTITNNAGWTYIYKIIGIGRKS